MSVSTATTARVYLLVFAALLVLTILTVATARLDVPVATAVTVGLLIASLKAALVALYFMHLRHERRAVHLTLAFTAIFAVGLFVLTLASEADHVPGTRFAPAFDATEVAR